MRSPYRHSVWFEVFGIVLLGAVLLGGAGYLLYRAGGAAGGLREGGSGGDVPGVAQGHRGGGARLAQRPRGPASFRTGPGPLLGSRSGPSVSGTQAPFSADWREGATPDLTGPSAASSGGDSRGGGLGSASGPSIASSRPSGELGSGSNYERETGGSGWRAEARRLAGRARALSSQLRQMDRSSSGSGEQTSPQDPASTSAAGTKASASGPGSPDDPSRRGDPGSPTNVPIDDHVYWLTAAGLLWGIWRLWRGG